MWISSDAAMNGITANGGGPTSSSGGSATRLPRKCTSAVSSSLSPLDFTSAFQPACSTAPNSTASTIGQVSAIVRRSFDPLARCARVPPRGSEPPWGGPAAAHSLFCKSESIGASTDGRMRVAVSAPADSRIG